MRSKTLVRLLPVVVLAMSAGSAMAEEAAKATEEAKPGLLDFDLQSAIWVLVIFLVLAYVLYQKAWKNVLAGLTGREEKIRNDISQAELARTKAEAALKEYNDQLAVASAKAQEILAKATSDALALADRIRLDADKAANDRAERAARDITEARDQALRQIYEQAADLSTSIAEKILRRNLNVEDQRWLVTESLQQLQNINRG